MKENKILYYERNNFELTFIKQEKKEVMQIDVGLKGDYSDCN